MLNSLYKNVNTSKRLQKRKNRLYTVGCVFDDHKDWIRSENTGLFTICCASVP